MFDLNSISGCVSPSSGGTDKYEIKYNEQLILSYYKRDLLNTHDLIDKYIVVCVFGNYTQHFTFHDMALRDTFYDSLP